MKKAILIAIVFIVPLILIAGVFESYSRSNIKLNFPASRAYRMMQMVFSDKVDEAWIPNEKVDVFYNSINPAQADSFSMSIYDFEQEEWIPNALTSTISYNDAGYILENVIYMNYGMMIPYSKAVSEYDDQNRIIACTTYESLFDRLPDFWAPTQRIHIEYGAGTSFYVVGWNLYNSPENYFKMDYTFDIAGRITEELSYVSSDSLEWNLSGKTEFQYHPEDTLTGEEFIEYVARNLPMRVMNEGMEYPGLITSQVYYNWFDELWLMHDREVSSFAMIAGEIRRTEKSNEFWDGDFWFSTDRDEFAYDINGNLIYEIESQWEMDAFVENNRKDYIWEFYTSVDDPIASPVSSLMLSVYPIPFNENVTIATSGKLTSALNISIYNSKGQLVKNFNNCEKQTISWDGKDSRGQNVSTGIYFVKATQGGESQVKRTIRIK